MPVTSILIALNYQIRQKFALKNSKFLGIPYEKLSWKPAGTFERMFEDCI
jgi:hypothetical protein